MEIWTFTPTVLITPTTIVGLFTLSLSSSLTQNFSLTATVYELLCYIIIFIFCRRDKRATADSLKQDARNSTSHAIGTILYTQNVNTTPQLETTPLYTALTALPGHGWDSKSIIGTVPAKTGRLATILL